MKNKGMGFKLPKYFNTDAGTQFWMMSNKPAHTITQQGKDVMEEGQGMTKNGWRIGLTRIGKQSRNKLGGEGSNSEELKQNAGEQE